MFYFYLFISFSNIIIEFWRPLNIIIFISLHNNIKNYQQQNVSNIFLKYFKHNFLENRLKSSYKIGIQIHTKYVKPFLLNTFNVYKNIFHYKDALQHVRSYFLLLDNTFSRA